MQQATLAAAEFIRSLPARDYVGLVTMPYGGVRAEPTRDRAYVLKQLPAMAGQGALGATESDKSCRTRDTLNALADHLTGLAGIEGPKTIVFISQGMMTSRRDGPTSRPPG